jgi:hypothetical protein
MRMRSCGRVQDGPTTLGNNNVVEDSQSQNLMREAVQSSPASSSYPVVLTVPYVKGELVNKANAIISPRLPLLIVVKS